MLISVKLLTKYVIIIYALGSVHGSDRLRKGQLLRIQLRLGREYKVEWQTKMTRNTTPSGLLNHDINQLVIEKIT